MAIVKIPPVLRKNTGNFKELNLAGNNVAAVLTTLYTEHPGVKDRLLNSEGDLNRFINLYLNDEDVRLLQGLETPVKESDILVILPAMAGGAH